MLFTHGTFLCISSAIFSCIQAEHTWPGCALSHTCGLYTSASVGGLSLTSSTWMTTPTCDTWEGLSETKTQHRDTTKTHNEKEKNTPTEKTKHTTETYKTTRYMNTQNNTYNTKKEKCVSLWVWSDVQQNIPMKLDTFSNLATDENFSLGGQIK